MKRIYVLFMAIFALPWTAISCPAGTTAVTKTVGAAGLVVPDIPPKFAIEFEHCAVNVPSPTGAIETRRFLIHVPKTNVGRMPALIGFHGAGGSDESMGEIWQQHTDQGFIMIFPTAAEIDDNGTCKRKWKHMKPGWTWSNLDTPMPSCTPSYYGADMVYIKKLLDTIEVAYNPTGFYGVGFSSGAGMIYQTYITRELARRFKGFAAVSNTINETKYNAHRFPGVIRGPFHPNTHERRPFMFVMGTADALNIPWIHIKNKGAGFYTPGATPEENFNKLVREVLGKNKTLITPRKMNLKWLHKFNNASPYGIESLYPDQGMWNHKNGRRDETMAVLQQFPAKKGVNSAPVAMVTIINGEHNWPGKESNTGTCFNGNCDFKATHEILNFWRATAGFENNMTKPY